jgi:RHS repeat-associated protein
MQLASSARIPDGFMAAMRLGGEKPHQGLPGRNPALYQGPSACNSTTALGLRGQAELNRVGSCSTGKERDTESGNDYFGARYYASTMGRFLSPDWSAKLEPVPYAKLDNPQSLNLYSYVLNNPLSAADPDGHETPEEVAKKNVDNAKISRGTDRYDVKATVVSNGQVFTSGKDKCNLYVSETMKNSTGEHTTVDGTGKIPTAAQFADPNVKITGLSAPEPMANAKPGDVIAQDHGANPTSGNEEGHVGIVVSLPRDGQPGQTASANANEGGRVTINDWGFRSPTANPNNGERSGASSPAPVVRHPLGDQ